MNVRCIWLWGKLKYQTNPIAEVENIKMPWIRYFDTNPASGFIEVIRKDRRKEILDNTNEHYESIMITPTGWTTSQTYHQFG